MSERNRLYSVLQVGNTWLSGNRPGWDENCYRDLLARNGATEKDGKISASTMDLQQLELALREMKDLGFKPRRKGSSNNDWRAPRIRKLNAMWCAMADADVVENRSTEAMHKWCENQVPKMTKLAWCTSDDLNKAVEMMKAMAKANGVDVE